MAQHNRSTAGTYDLATSLALLAPLVALLSFAFLYPVGRLLWGSMFAPDFTFAHYERLYREPLYFLILLRTFEIALLVGVATLLLGYPIAYAMARASRHRAMLIAACVLVPLWTSVLVRSYAWIVLLQRRGIVNNTLLELGLIETPLRLLYTEGAVILAMIHVLLPFMILPIYSVLRGIPDEFVKAARNLGAGPVRAFCSVTLPLSIPGIAAGTLMTFVLALGFYITPALVGGPSTLTLATLIGQQTTELLNWPFAGALAGVLLAATLVLVILFRRTLALNRGLQIG